MRRPRLLILAKPTEGIQPAIIKNIEEVIRALRHGGPACRAYFDFARDLADTCIVIERGEMVARGRRGEMDEALVCSYLTV